MMLRSIKLAKSVKRPMKLFQVTILYFYEYGEIEIILQ